MAVQANTLVPQGGGVISRLVSLFKGIGGQRNPAQNGVQRPGTNGVENLPGGPNKTPLPAVTDPQKVRDAGEVKPSDFLVPPPPAPEQDTALVSEILRKVKEADQWRSEQAYLWALCRRYDKGDQWYTRRFENGTCTGIADTRSAEDRLRSFTVNMISPLLQRVVALATQSRPDASPMPLTPSPMDRAAAEEARGILGHYSRKFKDSEVTPLIVYDALRSTSSGKKHCYLPNAEALLPSYDEMGNIVGSYVAPVGDIWEETIPGEEWFYDPSARTDHEAGWGAHVRQKPLAWFQDNFGEAGLAVEAEAYVEQFGSGADTSYSRFGWSSFGAPKNRPNAATCIEYWEKPNRVNKWLGRLIIIGGKRLLWNGPWPFEKKDKFPVSWIGWKTDHDSPYALNLCMELIDAQAIINREWSRILARLDKDKMVLYVQKLSGVGGDIAETVREMRDLILITFNPGTPPPTIANTPAIGADHYIALDRALGVMERISGIVDVLQGKVPPGVSAGITIDLLMQEAKSQHAQLFTSIENYAVSVGEWRIALAQQYFKEERLIGLDDTGTATGSGMVRGPIPKDGEIPEPPPMTGPQAFKALQAGGQTRVQVTQGSAIPKSTAGQNDEIINFYKLGLFEPTPAARMAVQLLTFTGTDRVISMMDREIERIEQANAELLAQQERMQAADLAAKQQEQQANLAAQADGENQKAQLAEGAAMLKAQTEAAKQKGQTEQIALKAQTDAQQIQLETQAKAALADQTHAYDLQKLMISGVMNKDNAKAKDAKKPAGEK